jgi:valyl-tRNA synthetase
MQEITSEIPKAYEPREAESKWYRIWSERGYFRAADVSDKPAYCIVIPPPNVTGALHMGHALTLSIQDLLIRWKRMSGANALWLPGTDHAGIATQMVVERDLKKNEHKSRHDLGREEFLRRVWRWKEKYGGRITEQEKVLGASCDWERERFTMDEGLSRAVREAFVRLFEEGLIYRAQRLINWCPRCHTALSDLEVEHEEKSGHLWHIAYPVKGSDRRLVVATTRPETMLGDTAVAVHPEDPRYRDLIGQIIDLPLLHREIPIIGDPELVSMEFGTGAVKVTPAHDFNDYATGLRHGLPTISIFDLSAHLNENAGPYRGLDRKAAREKVLADLEAQGLLVKTEGHSLAIGVCQRCADVVEPALSPQWFVKIAPLAEPAIKAVEEGRTQFLPESWTNTYFAWMRNLHDWCISRQLWWGHQIPAWYCECGEVIVRRDDPTSCPKCGSSALKRDEDVLDTWFSSGLWPFSTLGWPEKTQALSTFYPTSVMETGHDIIFFWVARMMMFGLHFMGDVPFRTVFLHAMVRDEKGDKMSKVKGNVIDPLDVVHGQPKAELLPADLRRKLSSGLPAYGADALRFTLTSLTAQGRDIKLSLERVEGYRNFANKIWNASRFALMNLGDPASVAERSKVPVAQMPLSLADRWIASRLERAVAQTAAALEAFKFNEAANAVYQFVWGEFCDWYIELSKGALYGADEEAKGTTRAMLVYVLDRFLRLLHPIMPFITEEIWRRLPRRPGDPESIMVAPYPVPEPALVDARAEEEMATVIAAIDGVRNIRGESNIAPSKKFRAILHAGPEVRAVLERNRAYVEPLAGLSALEILPPGAKPRVAATFVHAQMEIFVPLEGVIDLAEEERRIQKEMAKVEADLALLAKKLSNPSFAERAPKEVVEKDRARIAELEEKRGKLQQGLARLKAAPAAAPRPDREPQREPSEAAGEPTSTSEDEPAQKPAVPAKAEASAPARTPPKAAKGTEGRSVSSRASTRARPEKLVEKPAGKAEVYAGRGSEKGAAPARPAPEARPPAAKREGHGKAPAKAAQLARGPAAAERVGEVEAKRAGAGPKAPALAMVKPKGPAAKRKASRPPAGEAKQAASKRAAPALEVVEPKWNGARRPSGKAPAKAKRPGALAKMRTAARAVPSPAPARKSPKAAAGAKRAASPKAPARKRPSSKRPVSRSKSPGRAKAPAAPKRTAEKVRAKKLRVRARR